MKKILFFSLMIACLFSFGKCNKKKNSSKKKATTETFVSTLNSNEVWMQYDETKCANPWNFNWFVKPTQEQILGAIKSDLSGKEINILEINSILVSDVPSCEGCECLNGIGYFVRVNSSEIKKLKVLKFYEVKNVPDFKKINNNK